MPEGFEQLLVWQRAHALMLFIHSRVVPLLPPEEKWDLAIQIRKSSKSVKANIAVFRTADEMQGTLLDMKA